MREIASLMAALLSPASADADSLARALLACHRSHAAAAILAGALHRQLHGEEMCRGCSDPAPLLMAIAAGPIWEEEMGEWLVKDSHAVYGYVSQPGNYILPQKHVLFRSAAVLLLVGCPDQAAYLAKIAHDESPKHSYPWVLCPVCCRLQTASLADSGASPGPEARSSGATWR